MKRLIILPFAELDIKDTVAYYNNQKEGLEQEFINCIHSSFQDILENPEAFPIKKHSICKYVVDKFKFCIFLLTEKMRYI